MMKLLVSPNPHIHSEASTQRIMGDVLIALAPVQIISILFYGWNELLLLAVCVASCVLLEWAITKWMLKRPSTISDLSAAVTAVILNLCLPASSPWWIALIGAVMAIGVTKLSFGGLGQNVFNPAATARVFLLVSFPAQMTDWTSKGGLILTDAFSGATLLGKYSEDGVQAVANSFADPGSLFFQMGGSSGEISILAILAGFVYLLVRGVIKPWIPLATLGTVAAVSAIFNAVNPDLYTGPLFNLVTGGLLFASVFMATDYVTSPMTIRGGLIFGAGIGLITILIRYFGSYPEGVSFAILLMNMAVPFLDRWFHSKVFGSK